MTKFRNTTSALALILAGLVVQPVLAAEPGTVPVLSGAPGVRANPEIAAAGLKVFYRKFGRYRAVVSAGGSNNATFEITINKPSAKAVVDKAYLMSASNGAVVIDNGDVTIDGKSVAWMSSVTNDVPSWAEFFHSNLADVTTLVKAKINAVKSTAPIKFTMAEGTKNGSIDGEVLVVVFKMPAPTVEHTVALMFGAQQLAGDKFEITLAKPINPAVAGAKIDMGLASSYSYQENATPQYSEVDVNGKRLSTSAGGSDDGEPANGALITVGGRGDLRANPVDPMAPPANARTDDELYNLLPFVKKTSKIIQVETRNPSNDDNIFFSWFDLSGKAEINQDTDGDGLLDTWEKNGYDWDGDGKIDVPINKRGADYRHKDIFIAYAWMEAGPSETKNHKPSAAVLKAVAAAFKAAPVKNPDGKTGITVHFLNKGPVPYDADLNPAWDEFDAIMDPLVDDAEQHIYHRLLSGVNYNASNSSGLSRDIPASDFIETLGIFPSNPGTFKERAGTIMHELGHNLGLRHGGIDHTNYKPNHLSVMSYLNQMNWLTKAGKAKLDYERFLLKDLDEAALNEKAGLSRKTGTDTLIAGYGVRWFVGGVMQFKGSGADKNIDWNKNGALVSPVTVDLNNDGSTGVLSAGFNEWANIVFDGGSIGPGAESSKARLRMSKDDLKEMTVDDYRRLQGKEKN